MIKAMDFAVALALLLVMASALVMQATQLPPGETSLSRKLAVFQDDRKLAVFQEDRDPMQHPDPALKAYPSPYFVPKGYSPPGWEFFHVVVPEKQYDSGGMNWQPPPEAMERNPCGAAWHHKRYRNSDFAGYVSRGHSIVMVYYYVYVDGNVGYRKNAYFCIGHHGTTWDERRMMFTRSFRDLIRAHDDVFPSSFSYAGIPPMRDVEHSIQLVPDYRVHHQAPYRLSIPEATELERQLEELLRLGFIKPSNSPWGAPVLFARRADGTLRLCIDYLGLDHHTVKNSYPMPRSDELFDRLAGNRFFTKIDLRSGYHQIRVAAADQPKTAFRSSFGHYEFTVMPFGLTNAPATFQRVMNDIFRDILDQYVLVYLDDILVYSRTLEEHLRHLRDVLHRLRIYGFYAKLSKCRFAQHKVDFLGQYVSDQGLHMDDAKITAIAEWPAPTSAKQLRSFLGLTNYYSNFIRGYARYSYVLTSTLLRKNPPWAWTPLHEDAFRALKKAVTCAPDLHQPDFDRPFILTTDALDFAVGAVLSQVFPSSPDSSHPRLPRFPPPTPTTASRLTPTCPATDEPSIDYSPTIAADDTVESRSGDCPIAFYSRQLLPAEINYTADEREVLAVVYAARHWRHYLHGAPFTVRTDNSVVQAFLTKPKLTPRQARWWRDLSEFSFTTEHIKGETNQVADALSRRPDHDQELIQLSCISVTTVHHSVIDEFRTQYRHCPDYRDIHATLRSGKTVPNYSLGDNGLVYWHGSQGTREPRICVPSTGQLRVRGVAEFHDQAAAGHMGFHKTLARVSRLHVWPKRKDFVKDYVEECPTCKEVNSMNHLPYGLLQPLPILEGRWQSISMDFIGPLRPPTPRGHDAILVVVDRFTKRARFVPCRYAISAREVADILFDRVVCDRGLPLSVISDSDPRFTSRFWRRLYEREGRRPRQQHRFRPAPPPPPPPCPPPTLPPPPLPPNRHRGICLLLLFPTHDDEEEEEEEEEDEEEEEEEEAAATKEEEEEEEEDASMKADLDVDGGGGGSRRGSSGGGDGLSSRTTGQLGINVNTWGGGSSKQRGEGCRRASIRD
ncbi:hypothetical protein CBR_g17866 [Chara braunii]|uniref:Reverse transcriptase n=1 Tax=Chara braunii TaxID=69332 RepID=A0A388KW30_CHABU|nr:hypothetical protein CBR_g17866 [Chara braunii]|eukprot:GBG74153.1 hypothetical protein CBR_g17866 [Chara braunii]